MITLLCGLAAVWIFLRWFESANLYAPNRTLTAHPGTYGLKYENLSLTAEDGPKIHGWFIPRGAGDPVMLVCHGNAGNISHRLDKALIFRKAGASVLLFDYRGYGQSGGSPSEQGTYRDAEAAYAYLTETRGIAPERIVLYGESLGCGVAVELALKHKTAGLILDSAFTSTPDMAREIFGRLPLGLIIRFRYDNLSKIPRVSCPMLIMHSRQDDIVPFRMGQALFAAAPEPKKFFEMTGGHNDGFLETGQPYADAIAERLNAWIKR